MGSVFSGKARCAEDAAHHVEKARGDPSRKESPEPLYALNSYVDVHLQLF